jgi:regulator of sirC expression with transglutaminase-like and TPR domain
VRPVAAELDAVLADEPIDLARGALAIARLEYPDLDPEPTLHVLDRLARQATQRLAHVSGSVRAQIAALNGVIFEDEGFAGNRTHYDDFRNSLLNVVIERRVGIPLTLALVYMEVARRAGVEVRGVAFPGHFLMRVPAVTAGGQGDDLILDPFDAGAERSQGDCRALLARHLGHEDDESAPLDPALLHPCTPRHMLARMLNNLKRTYVELRSFPQARCATSLLLAVDPTRLSELRDRGLLAYHLDDFPAALRDLGDYLRLNTWGDESAQGERDQIRAHVKTLTRRVAGMN